MKKLIMLMLAFLVLTGCAAKSGSGVVSEGPDTYMVSRQAATFFSDLDNLKAEALQEASEYCLSQNKKIQVVNIIEPSPARLFGNFPRTAKKAAAYGLRSMNGRMKKMASEVLKEGLKHHNRITREACEKSLLLMEGGTSPEHRSQGRRTSGRFRIRGIPKKSGTRTRPARRRTVFNR